jgi:pimeloyl-ACP methyl ester carboxylesterase
LRRAIEGAGYATWARTYPSRKMPIDELTGLLAQQIREEVGDGPVLGVTHSLGGILARHMTHLLPWQGVVMLAPPNTGSTVAAALRSNPLFRVFSGPAGKELGDPAGWPAPPEPFAVIAGTKGASVGNPPSWAIRALGILPQGVEHDGTVTVPETKIQGMRAFATVDASHTWIMNHPEARALVLKFLETKRF